VVLVIAAKKGVLRELARMSNVSKAAVTHAVMLFNRISLTVSWGGISGERSFFLRVVVFYVVPSGNPGIYLSQFTFTALLLSVYKKYGYLKQFWLISSKSLEHQL
jgi:hypothetical protein